MSFPVSSHAVDKKTAFRIEKAIKEFHQEIINTRRYIHMNPELSNREHETAKLIASKLIALGFEVETGVAKTGIVGLLRGNQAGITAGIRADMDALPIQELAAVPYQSLNPGVMHACGHDFHTAVVLGTAMVMSRIKDQLKGNIKFIFQPAEEGPPQGEEGGASLMIEEGILENPSVQAIFGFHVWPENVGKAFFSRGSMMASSDSFEIVIKGKSSHGARPHEGIDAISLAAQTVVSIQSIISRTIDPTNPAVVSIGKIHGGIRSNIIAEEVRLEGTIRTLDAINRDRIGQQIENIVKGITQPFNADYTFSLSKGAPPVYNHPEFADIMLPSLYDVLGRENVNEIAPQMVAEDFSYFGQKIPGFYFFLGVKDPQQDNMAPLHSPYFNPDERSIPLGIKIMSHLLLDCLDYHSRIDRNYP
jgi:amidohydrolase